MPRRPLLLETFEDRILCDAAPTLETPAAHEALLAALNEQMAMVAPATADAAPTETRELVLVNDNVADRDLLISSLLKDAPGRVFEVRVLDSSRDGVEQVSALLEAGGSFDAVHVIGHADSSGFWLGGTRIDAQSLEALANPLSAWQAHLTPGADFLLYGCDLALTAEGQALANRLGVLTGTDVAASTDTTGSAVLGGDWQLEFQFGNITSTLPTSPDAWRHKLAGDLQVEVIAAPNFVVDSNLGASPQAAMLIAKVTNTGTDALTDVFLNMGDFGAGTPGIYQTTTWPGLTGTFSLTHEGGASDATRYLGTIQPGETLVQYWLVSYALTDANGDAVFGAQADPSDDLVLQYDVWATASDGGTPLTTNQANTVALRSEISAMANKVWPNTTSKVPDDYLQAFDDQLGWRPVTPDPDQSALLQGVWYDLGRINQGYDADANLVPDYDAFLQPVGNPTTFDANATRLISSYGVLIVKLNDGTEQVIAFRDKLYFKDIPANNTGVVGLVFYQFAQIGLGSSQLSPYQEAASGSNNEKFNGDYGASPGGVVVSAAPPTFDKTVSLGSATPGTTVTYTLTTTAAPTSGYGLPLNGLPMVMQDSIPTGTTYVAGSAQAVAVPGGTVTILYSANGGTSWTTTEPAAASVTNIQWWFSDALAAAQVASVSFQTTINGAFTGQLVVNDAGVGLGNNPPAVRDQEVTYILGSRTISGLVFRDEGTGGGTASDGLRNGTESGLQSIDVSLYLDLNANGVIDSTDVLRATTLSVAGTGAWSFTNLTNGSYIVKVDRGDTDRPTGWTLSTTDLRTAVINNANVTGLEFGYAPILDVEKNLVGGSPVFEGDLVSYTIDVTNLLGGHGGSTLPVSQDIWLSTNGASTFTNAASALSVPDGNVATGASNQVLIGTNPLGFVAQNSVVSVMALIKVQLSGALVNDTLDISILRNGVSVGTVTLTAAQLNGFIASAGTVAVDVSGLAQWTAADFTSATTGLTVNYTRVGANDAITASIDGYGYRVSTAAVDPSAGSLYYSDATDNSIARALPNGANRTTLLSALGDDPNDIAYDPVAEKIYWSVTTGGFIRRANLDGTNVETIVTGGGTITGLDIDAVNRTLWWSDIAGDRIVRANLDSTGQTVVLSALNDPQAIAVDAAGGKIYWGESQGNTMKRANLDGTGTQTILSKAIFGASFNFPEDIELDTVGGKIYWTDSAAGGFVGRANLDGTGSQTLLSGGSPLGLGLDVAAGLLYYSTGTAVVRANLDGSSQQTVFSGLGTGREVEVFGSSTVTNTSTFDINSTLAFVPLTDTYDPAKLQYVSSSLTPSSVAGGTITWANIGPLNGGITDRITVTFRALEPAGNVATTVTNTATSSGSLLANGQAANTDTDFVTAAMQPTANIGDVIWNDGNSNGTREANEGGISGVQFQLLNSAAQVIATTMSDSAGAYLFTGVRDGTYTVRVVAGTLPAGMVQSFDADGVGTANQSTLTIASAANNLAQDFGYGGRFLLSGTVWRDYDRDGVLDSVETALTGATVALTVGGVSQGSSTLDAAGGYRFSIPTATAAAGAAYVLTVTTPAGTWTQTADPNGTPLTNPFSSNLGNPLTSNTLANQNFAFYQTGTSVIGDTLFFDWNQNGAQDATDEGIPNITVTLFADLDADGTLDATDAQMLTTTTNASGVYQFANLPAGSFIVVPDTNDVDFPTNTTPTLATPHALTLPAATTNNAVDFGFYKAGTGTIGGTVWTDRNGDQLQAGIAELGIAGVTVTLQADLNNDGVFVNVATATTSATGAYSFASLPFASFRVVVSATDPALPLDAFDVPYSPTTVLTRNLTLSSGAPDGTADYGFAQLGSVGDTVFYDANRNATQDYNETGIAGVQVRLLNSASAVVATVTTDADGHYRFTGLTPDTYTAEVLTATLPAGITAANLTGDPDRDGVPTWDNTYPGLPAGDHRDSSIVINYGTGYSGADFGYEPPGVVGDFIFRDMNGNGIQESNELGISNVTVTLTQGATVLTTASDPDGFYFFQFVGTGTWTIAVTQPAGYVVTGGIDANLLAGTGSVGANSATLTMDAAGVLTQINGTALTTGNQKIDFGYRLNGTNNLSGTVVIEQQGATDGNSGEATDSAVAGVTVFLLDGTNTVLGSTLTNAAGQYSFSTLPNGTFRVSMTAGVPALQYTQLTTVTGNTPAAAVVNNGTSAYQTLNLAGSASGVDFAWVSTVDYDFGDLPDSYRTTLATDGARHIISGAPTLYLGATPPDVEADATPGAGATGDGADEDGISTVNPGAWFEGVNGGTIRAVVQGSGWLVGWIDFNNDGNFLDAGEMIVSQAVATGTQDFTFDVPTGALIGGAGTDLYARFRLFTAAPPIPALASVGVATGGEIEDYSLRIGSPVDATISGSAYQDANNDGVFQVGETAQAGVTITLTGTDELGGAVNLTTTTNAGGAYTFSTLRAGTYTVTETQPAGLLDGKNTAGSSGGTTVNNPLSDVISGIVLGASVNATGYNFGELSPNSLAGTVWRDLNNDGVQLGAGETGIGGVAITLTGADDLGTAVNTTTATNGSGAYAFATLRPGTYTITETQPASLLDGKETVGSQASGTIDNATNSNTISAITLGTGTSGTGNNFGELPPSALSGSSYIDANNDGIFQGGETAQPGVTITLTGTDDRGAAVNVSTTTDAAGAYSFASLRPGTYTVTETQPAGMLDGRETSGAGVTTPGTVDNTAISNTISNIVVAAGQTGSANNFADLSPSSFSGTAYRDLNNDGIQSGAGETGIAAVTITLTGTDDFGAAVSLTTTSDASGAYVFATLRPGTYTITETPPAGLLDGKETVGSQASGTINNAVNSDTISAITLASGVSGAGNNFGELPPTSLAGTIFSDVNNDGVQQAGDSAIGGATITLTGTDDRGAAVSLSATSDAGGAYSFTALRPGSYVVTETQPVGFLDGKNAVGSAGGTTVNNPPDDVISAVVLASNTTATGYNFAELAPASLAGLVFNDVNDDGVQQAGDNAIGGVTITLTGTDDLGTAISLTTATNGGGAYAFGNLRPGTYTLTETQPAGVLDGRETAGTGTTTPGAVDNSAVSNTITGIVVGSGQTGVANNFAELSASSLAGTVFRDLDDDGTQAGAGETGVAGVTVTLTGADDFGAAVNVTTTTDAGGNYAFANLRPGTYTITETQPAGLLDGKETVGAQASGTIDNTTNSNTVAAITLVTGVSGTGNNFGDLPPSSFAGTVFIDADNDGIQSGAGETGISGATVTLTGTDDRGSAVGIATTTDAAGAYSFGTLRPGSYTLTETQPAGFLDGQNSAGTAGGTTVNNPPSDVVSAITLAANTTATGYDFGELQAGTLSGSAYIDANNDGIFQGGETAQSGVTITLTGTDDLGTAINVSTTTNAAGAYTFAALRPGTYTLTETQAAGVLDGRETAGGGVTTPGAVNNAIDNDTIAGIVIASGETGAANNFGDLAPSVLGATVYRDLDNDGIQSGASETGIVGVTVTLTGTDDRGNTVNTATLTDVSGNVSFTALRPGTYTITETQSAAFLDGMDSNGTPAGILVNDQVSNIVLLSGTDGAGYTFGELPIPTVSGTVYRDLDNDGIQSGAGETGIAGVSITLTGNDDLGAAVSLTTTTDVNGGYSFTGMRPSDGTGYTLTETQPGGFLDGKNSVGTSGGTTINNPLTDEFLGIVLPVNTDATGYNFGELPPSTLGGSAYIDANNDGTFQGGETAQAGATITLTGTDDLGAAVNLATTSAADGTYAFGNLRPGTYTLAETQPTGLFDGRETVGAQASGTVDNTADSDTISGIVLAANVAGTANDFADLRPASLAGAVFSDGNNDGLVNGADTGISGATVTLAGTDDRGTAVNVSTTTNGSGAYAFGTLRPGTYTLTETQPAGFFDGLDTIGTPGGTVANDVFSGIALTEGTNGADNNFAELAPASLAGSVYIDADNDGVRQGGESGLAGVTVTLNGNDDVGNGVSATTTTDATGAYSFGNLRPADATGYTITETQPVDYGDGTDAIGTQGGTAGNDVLTGIVLSAGVGGTGNDFGERIVADLSITKTDGSASYTAGTAISYTVVVSNGGPSFVTSAVVADTIPANISGATWTAVYAGVGSAGAASGSGDINEAINLASGGSATFTITGTVLSTATGNLVNTATVAAPAGVTDSDPGNNSATDTDTANPVADLSITKTDGVASVVPGTATTYTIVVSNTGPSFVTGATVADTLPAALTGVSWTAVYAGAGSAGAASGSGNISTVIDLAVGGTATFTVTGTVVETATGTLVNTATVTPPVGVTDPTPGDNTATDTDTLTPVADLSVTKTDGSATYISGTAITYTVVVSNTGPSFVTGAVVADTIPANISGAAWTAVYAGAGSAGAVSGSGDINTAIDLASGGSATFTITGTVLLTATGNLVNTATVTEPASTTDPTPGNNTATDTDARDLTSLAGFVFNDANNDGIVQVGEGGIAGATVTLTGTDNLGGAVNLIATTAADGSYLFENLRPSDAVGYTITETQPAGFLDGTDTIGTPGGVAGNDVFSTVVLAQGVIGTGNNFGELAPSSLAGFVYNDTNNDGTAQVGESGIAGVTVTLTGSNDLGAIAPVAVTTLADGSYTFGNLRPGTYAITETQPGAFLDGADTIGTPGGATGSDTFTGIVLATGTDGAGNNFGELRPATLSGTVFQDDSNDGTQQPGESGVAGVTVTLTGTDDLGTIAPITATTLADGSYSFGNLRPGTYAIAETQAAGLLDGKDALGTAGGALANDQASAITLTEGQTGGGYTFGELAASSFSGTVFSDLDNNGAIDPGETGIGGAAATLTGTDDLGNAVALSTSSAADGTYGFGSLRPGTYTITETQPAGFLDGQNTAGTAGGTTVNNPPSDVISAITLPSNTGATGYLFAELAPASLGGTVFHDLNNDGVNDPADLPVAGATVTLTGTDDLGGAVNTGTITAADGTYTFANLRPGTYTLTETQPATHRDGIDTLGTAGGTPANDAFSAIAIAVGQTGDGYLFGELSAPDLVVTKSDGTATAKPGGLLTYTITVANASLQQADSVTVTDQFPSSLEFISADNGGVLDPGTGVITWNVGAIAGSNAQTVTLTVIARVPAAVPASLRAFTNAVTALDISGVDANPGNNTARDTDSIPASADLYVFKTDSLATAKVGQQTTYAITGGNAGARTAEGVVISDTLPAGLRFVSASNGGQLVNGRVVWNLGDLAPGATFQLSVRVVVEAAAGGKNVINSVTITDRFGSFEDPTPFDNSATDATRIESPFLFAFDTFHHFGSRDQRPGFLPHLGPIDVSREALLPLAPVYSGEADPGATLVVSLYNSKGEQIGSQTVMVDAGGNWLTTFTSSNMRDTPSSVRISLLPAPSSFGDSFGHNLRAYFSPALNPGHFFQSIRGLGFDRGSAPLLQGLGLENPLQLGSVKYGGELLSTQGTAGGE